MSPSFINDGGGPAFPCEQGYIPERGWNQTFCSGLTVRDYFAAHVQADDRLVKAVRAMDDVALAWFALRPDLEREEWITETGHLNPTDWDGLAEVEKVVKRLTLEAKAIARVRFMQADAMLAEREKGARSDG